MPTAAMPADAGRLGSLRHARKLLNGRLTMLALLRGGPRGRGAGTAGGAQGMVPRRWYIVGLLGLAAIALAHVAGIAGPQQRLRGDPDFISPDAALDLLVDGAKEDLTFSEGVVVTCDRCARPSPRLS
jgi:hypothetical protein